MSEYYVYAYLRDDGSPYYIGKGKGNRAYTKSKGEISKPVDKTRIVILEQGLAEVDAFTLEKQMIGQYGRKDNNTGILRNLTDGGETTFGYKHTENWKKENGKRTSYFNKIRWKNDDFREKMSNNFSFSHFFKLAHK